MIDNKSTLRSIYTVAITSPDKEAIISDDKILTYADLWSAIQTVSDKIIELQLGDDKRVGILSSDKLHFLIGIFGILNAGCIAVPLSDETPYTEPLSDDISYILTDNTGFSEITNKEIKIISLSISTHCSGDTPPLIHENYLPSMILHSSGTSGVRKGIVISRKNLRKTTYDLVVHMDIDSDIREYLTAPICHAFGFMRTRVVLGIGGSIVMNNNGFEPVKTLSILKKYNCNSISGVSSSFIILMKYFAGELQKLSSQIKWMEIGSMPMNVEYKKKLISIFPSAKICMNYGMTEAMRSTFITLNTSASKINTVGKAFGTNQVRIVSESGLELDAGEVGTIEVKGDNLALGYWQNMDLWNERTNSGWFNTGDIGKLDADGYLTYLGRDGDIINNGGNKYSVLEIENNIEKILDSCVFCITPVEDKENIMGQVAALCIEKESLTDINLNELKIKFRTVLPKHLIPKDIYIVESIPKTFNGKIKRKELMELVKKNDYISI